MAVSMQAMLEATRLTRAGRLLEATALLRGLVSPKASPKPQPASSPPEAKAGPFIDMVPPASAEGSWTVPGPAREPAKEPAKQPARQPAAKSRAKEPAAKPPEGASFNSYAYRGPAGHRAYKLYVPAGATDRPRALIVMLHGCTQSPDDFAAGTGMNRIAEEHDMLIAYPAQSQAANAQKCWNWFQPKDQRREGGEPAIIAGITRQIARDFAVDPRRIYVAGLSAGGAAAAVMADTYPELFAAVGVHSGLACGAARDIPSAFAAMKGGAGGVAPRAPSGEAHFVPTILFHGDRDATVHPVNGDQVLAQRRTPAGRLEARTSSGATPGGLSYTRTVETNEAGEAVLERWLIHGAGHAWSGGHPAGSYTEPRGPDASREMVRFFLANPKRA